MRIRPLLLLVVSAVSVAAVGAHHSLSEYDTTRRVTISATVREFHFVNPHPYLVVDGRVDNEVDKWRLELDNRGELVAIGMTSATFRLGDKLIVSGAPGRLDKTILYVRELDRVADGFRYEQPSQTPRIVIKPRQEQ